jgi:hypothetical protein
MRESGLLDECGRIKKRGGLVVLAWWVTLSWVLVEVGVGVGVDGLDVVVVDVDDLVDMFLFMLAVRERETC